jgi:hypothetical protein
MYMYMCAATDSKEWSGMIQVILSLLQYLSIGQ